MGFKQGGRPGYALRRIPVTAEGGVRTPLAPGERKPVPTDRVTLGLGAPDEVALVRRIYRWYVRDGRSDSDIARQLRSEDNLTNMGVPWTPAAVRRILTNERYCGRILFNQTTRRMHSKVAQNPESVWIRCENALHPVVSSQYFEKAKRIRAERATGPNRATVLANLRALYNRHGIINVELCRDPSIPGRQTMLKFFAGYIQAYAAAGIPVSHTATGALGIRGMRTMVEKLIAEVSDKAREAGATIERTPTWNIFVVNGDLRLKVSIASYRRYADSQLRWRVCVRNKGKVDYVLCALMNSSNERIRSYLLLPAADARSESIHLTEKRLKEYAGQSFATLDEVFGTQI